MVFLYQNCGEFQNAEVAQTENSDTLFRTSADENSQAIALYRRLGGVTLSVSDPLILQMEDSLKQGDLKGAASIAANTSTFYNITVRDFATKMSTREESVSSELNDFIATVIGSIRDNVSAINMMTGNYYYRAEGVPNVGDDLLADIVTSNNHYRALDEEGADLSQVLIREDGQKVVDESDNVGVLRDSAGLMTTRGWMFTHANAGTNRRLIEFAFQIFTCTPIEQWASTSRPDNFIGRDVARDPISEFQTKCKSCHSGMDALRPATAYFDYEETDAATGEGFVKYRYTYNLDPDPDDPDDISVPVAADEQLVPYKFRRATEAYPPGYKVTNSSWTNYASQEQFGFRQAGQGSGFNSFARLIASSQQFSRCMVQRVFKTVCRQELTQEHRNTIDSLSEQFENGGYNLRDLFIDVAVHPTCMGLGV